jgi:hypothetical protein
MNVQGSMFIVYVGPCLPLMTEEDLLCTGDRSLRFTFGDCSISEQQMDNGQNCSLS